MLMIIAGGLIAILLGIVLGLFLTSRPGMAVPNWAENVLVGIASVTGLRLGDCLSSLVQLASGRQIQQLGTQLAAAPAPGSLDVNVTNSAANPVPIEESGDRK